MKHFPCIPIFFFTSILLLNAACQTEKKDLRTRTITADPQEKQMSHHMKEARNKRVKESKAPSQPKTQSSTEQKATSEASQTAPQDLLIECYAKIGAFEISVMETADAEVIDVLIFSTESLAIYHLIANKTAAQRYSGTDGMSWINLEFADNEQVRVDVSLAEDDYQQFQIDHCAI